MERECDVITGKGKYGVMEMTYEKREEKEMQNKYITKNFLKNWGKQNGKKKQKKQQKNNDHTLDMDAILEMMGRLWITNPTSFFCTVASLLACPRRP